MHDPLTQICTFPSYEMRQRMECCRWIPNWLARLELFTLWHVDPARKGNDDSCGWFMRAHHGNPEVLEKIIRRFDEDWDRTFTTKKEDHDADDGHFVPKTYFCGYFFPEDAGFGKPNMGVTAIVLNLFFLAAGVHFESDGRTNWRKARKFMQKNLFEIMLFAENPTDSLRDEIVRKWGTDSKRADRIESVATCIYGWILRNTRPWYRHPRWHVRHWRVQIHIWQQFHRWAFERCGKCGGRFHWGEVPCGDWNGTRIWHMRCDEHLVRK